ncbi:beta-2 adrenergic receptor-like [Oculina patagonica]
MASLRRCNASCFGNTSSNETEPDSENSLLPSPLIVLLCIIGLLIIAVNGLVIALIHKKKTLRTITNMFLASLALSDLMSGLVGIPLLLICSVKDIVNVCVSSAVFIRFTAISSVCHVLLIACDRYIFIVHYMKYRVIVTKQRATASIITVWLFSLIVSVIQFSWYLYHGIAVYTEYEDITEDHNKKYSLACIVLFFAVPLLLMCYIYGRIFQISCKSKASDRQLSKNLQQPSRSLLHEWRGRSVLLITVVIFAGCWLPYFLAMLDDYMEFSENSPMPVWAERLLIFLAFIPPLLNPILCTLAKKDFRRALREVVFGREAVRQYNAYFQVSSNRSTVRSDLALES